MNRNKIYTDKDVKINCVKDKIVGIVGYGSQGRAQALNLKDSGVEVLIGLRKNSPSIKIAQDDGFKNILSIAELSKKSEIISLLIPDEEIPHVFKNDMENNILEGKTLLFSHGYCVHYDKMSLPQNVNIIMVAPSGAGEIVRTRYLKNSGIPNLIAIHQDFTKDAFQIALSYSKCIGGTRVGSFISTFEEEVVTDLFGEQAILTGGIPSLIKKSFDVLVNHGYSPTVAWFVCYYEVKAIIDLFYDKGFNHLNKSISNIAEYGGHTRGDFLFDDNFTDKLSLILKQITNGSFDEEWSNEKKDGYKYLKSKRKKTKEIEIEKINKKMLDLLNSKSKK